MKSAKLILDGNEYDLPVVVGTENEVGVDISGLRNETGAITFDPGYANTGACESVICYIDGENGILRYRGYPIEQLAEGALFSEVAYLLIYGDLPNREQFLDFRSRLTQYSMLHEDMKKFFEGYPPGAHPMAILSSMVASLSTYYPGSVRLDDSQFDMNAVRLLGQAKTIAAYAYKKSIGEPFVYPRRHLSYPENFLRMMFALPQEPYEPPQVFVEALSKLLILHAEHEQNCSTSTVRLVGSSQTDLFAAVSAGISALSGALHGGANQKVMEMLEVIHQDGGDYKKYINLAKDKDSGFRLMGFGHRIYKSYDPRAGILRKMVDRVLEEVGINNPLLEIAKRLEEVALSDEYFIERNLYPNVDFYSGFLYSAMGIPTDMFTVMFALGRLPGWIAHFKELRADQNARINRPRQIYIGPKERPFVPLEER